MGKDLPLEEVKEFEESEPTKSSITTL